MTISVLLKCNNLEETKSFYKDILGFRVKDSAENTLTAEKEDGKLIFTVQDLWPGRPNNSATIYFSLSQVDSYFNSLKDNSFVLWPLEKTSYGSKEFGIKDNNGYLLAFSQRIA